MIKNGEKCICGRVHSCDIEKIIIKSGAIKELPGLAAGYENILLVADKNTYAAAGKETAEALGSKIKNTLVYTDEGLLVPDEYAVKRLEEALFEGADLIVGVGSGVIQDLCKFVSFRKGLPYFIVATAPSMDGYASAGAAMIEGGMKVTYQTHVPVAIIGDAEILKNAPLDMIRAGYGDIIGKYSCLCDWRLSAVVNGEYLCPEIYDMTYEMLLKVRDLGPALMKRDGDAVCALTEALAGVGVAMAYAGNSRPASGSEHHLSHFFEVTGLLKNEPYLLHGVDVAYSTVITEKLREKLLDETPDFSEKESDEAAFESELRRVFGRGAKGVSALHKKAAYRPPYGVYREKWDEIKAVLSEPPSSAEISAMLASVGLYPERFEAEYSPEKVKDAVKFAPELKDRYTVLRLYNDLRKD